MPYPLAIKEKTTSIKDDRSRCAGRRWSNFIRRQPSVRIETVGLDTGHHSLSSTARCLRVLPSSKVPAARGQTRDFFPTPRRPTGADFTTCWPHIFIAFPYYQLHLILSRMRTKHEKEDGLVLGKIDGSRHSPAGFGPDSSYVRIAQRSCYQSIFKRLIIFSLFYFLFTFS